MKNQYAYQLQGQDQDWIYTTAEKRWATYTNLAAGDYTLRIKASNADGYWNEQGKSLKITILPPLWLTWPAYTLYALMFIGLVWAFVGVQRKKLRDEHAMVLQLQQVDKLKDEFLANTSHELRTPLNGIIGLAESLMDGAAGQLPATANKNLAMVVSSGKRLSNLVNDILDFSKLKHRHLTLQIQPVDLYSMTEVVLALSRPLLENKVGNKLQLINNVPQGIAPAQADENRLLQVLHNLVGNAIKFTDNGQVTVGVISDDSGLTLSVSDTGIGIAPDQLDNIFAAFEQLNGHRERLQSGTGLGLAVSQQLVKLHGGQIEVNSQPGKGSEFYFTLAKATQPATINNNNHQTVSRLHQFEVSATPVIAPPVDGQSGGRILLVDDEPINRQVLHNHLSLQNYQLVEASGGHQALQTIENDGPFDLVLLDIMMPKMSGYEVCQTIRKSHAINDLPVIFLTAKNQVTDMVQSFAVGGNDYLSKPINKDELLIRVQTHLKFLAMHRDLEAAVAERTVKLVQKNQQIELQHERIALQNQLLEQDNKEMMAER
jgi:signal transduction histidine kinase/DNA-binding response OmpR family regulator